MLLFMHMLLFKHTYMYMLLFVHAYVALCTCICCSLYVHMLLFIHTHLALHTYIRCSSYIACTSYIWDLLIKKERKEKKKKKKREDLALVEFMYLVFTHMPGESYRRRLGSLLLYLCDVFRALINSPVCRSCSLRLIILQTCSLNLRPLHVVPMHVAGFDLLDDCRSSTRAVQYALDYVDLYNDCEPPDNSTSELRLGKCQPPDNSISQLRLGVSHPYPTIQPFNSGW